MLSYYLELMSDCVKPALSMNLMAQRQVDNEDYNVKRTAEDIGSEVDKLIITNELVARHKKDQREEMRTFSLAVPSHDRNYNEKSAFIGVRDLCKAAELLFVFTTSYDRFLKQVPELAGKVYTALAGVLDNLKSTLNTKSVSAAIKAQAV